jgi:hypothetical protein
MSFKSIIIVILNVTRSVCDLVVIHGRHGFFEPL